MPWQIECRLRGADGDYRWFRMECAPQRDAAGEILAWVGIATIDVQNVEGEACSVTLLLPSVPLAPSPATRRAPFHTEELGVTLDSCD